ncbi:MAG: PEP-CTERM sorting domain-containing protein [Moorea sp. SIO3I6]|nr:PEP-CTERM sorting domain-containing protein [Moorena sp. SIO3I6]
MVKASIFATANILLATLGILGVEVKPATSQSLNLADQEQSDIRNFLSSLSSNNPTISNNNSFLNRLLPLPIVNSRTSGSSQSSDNILAEFITVLKVGTPGPDPFVGDSGTNIIFTRTGNDILLGVDPGAPIPGQGEIDILIGGPDSTSDGSSANAPTRDRFLLGDENNPYYAGGTGFRGKKDYALIGDFDPNQDTIRLHGDSSNYTLKPIGPKKNGTAIYLNNPRPDLIAVLPGASGLSVDGDYFEYDNTPPSQQPAFDNAQQLGSASVDIAFNVGTDSVGNVYVTGWTQGDLGQSNAGSQDAYVAKYNSQGQQQWVKQLGTSGEDRSFDISFDSNDNVYIAGTTTGNLGGSVVGGDDAYFIKLDSNGNTLLSQQYGTSQFDTAFAIDVDNNGNIYTGGYTTGDLGGVNAGSDQPIPLFDDPYVAKFDSNGNQLWAKQFGTVEFDELYGVAADNNGNVFATGFTTGKLGEEHAGLYDGWLTKFDSNGEQLWIEQFGTSNYDFAWDLALDSSGNVYSTGFTLGSLGGPNAGYYDAFLVKYDTDGNQLWTQQIGTSGSDSAFAIDIDSDGFIYISGITDGDLGGTNAGLNDVFIAKFDSDGNLLMTEQFGTPEDDFALFGIDAQQAAQVYLAGFTDGSLGGANAGSFDAWVASSSLSAGSVPSAPEPTTILGSLATLIFGAGFKKRLGKKFHTTVSKKST